MTNKNKWLIAVLFTLLVGVVVPGLVAGKWFWFLDRWQDGLYTALTVGMWLVATAFVDVDKPRGRRDRANALIPLGLVVAVPIAVWDRLYGLGRLVPVAVSVAAVVLGAAAIALGVAAWRFLGPGYSPRAGAQPDQALVHCGPYRTIRHPLYLAALMWIVAWPLILGSIVAPGVALFIVLPAILARIRVEEAELLRLHGEAYAAYREQSWRLIPCLY
jgi:protein-S-isoprenylcysteine O-methyltransferase Ste14